MPLTFFRESSLQHYIQNKYTFRHLKALLENVFHQIKGVNQREKGIRPRNKGSNAHKGKRNPRTMVQRNSRGNLCSRPREQEVHIGEGECKALERKSLRSRGEFVNLSNVSNLIESRCMFLIDNQGQLATQKTKQTKKRQLFTLRGKKQYKKMNILNINEYPNILCDSVLSNRMVIIITKGD